jgi:SPP1 family predicted phage head-tail adaptor
LRWNDAVWLVARAGGGEDENGDPLPPTETKRKVYANKRSVGRAEFWLAEQNKVKADMIFDVRAVSYGGERLLEHGGKRYRVYGTYTSKNGEFTELKCTDLSEGGNAGG